MAEQRSLWEHLETPQHKQEDVEQAERQQARQETIKRLRASGHWELLLRVARTIPQPFTLNDISIAVWKAHPEIFGMRGYPYPDNHKVHYILYGTRGLIAKGIVTRVRKGIFRVSDDPKAEELLSGPGSRES